jgi:glycosyltransferase involved in cell wall biosynthesis
VPVLHIDRPWAHRAVYHRLLRRCDAAILLTEAEAEFVRARGVANTTVAGGGVDPARFERRDGTAVRARYGLGSRPVVGFLGRQGVPTLIRAMRAVWLRNPGAILLMAGQSTHRDAAVTAELGALSPEERQRVVLIDDFPDPDGPSILDACDVVAQPSVEEAFGLVLLEAWMCGKPVIGADIAATRGIIESGVDGWLVKPFDPDDLADRLQALLADPGERAVFGRRGREKVLARFTWDRIVDAWEAPYRSVVSRRR